MFYHLLKISTTFFSRWPRISSISSPKISDDLFFRPSRLGPTHFVAFYISTVQNAPGRLQLHRQFLLIFFHHSLNIFSTFSQHFFGFHPSFPLSHFQIYNFNCTIALLQLQITFYNCRNFHQLHVKICFSPSYVKCTSDLRNRARNLPNLYRGPWEYSSLYLGLTFPDFDLAAVTKQTRSLAIADLIWYNANVRISWSCYVAFVCVEKFSKICITLLCTPVRDSLPEYPLMSLAFRWAALTTVTRIVELAES